MSKYSYNMQTSFLMLLMNNIPSYKENYLMKYV